MLSRLGYFLLFAGFVLVLVSRLLDKPRFNPMDLGETQRWAVNAVKEKEKGKSLGVCLGDRVNWIVRVEYVDRNGVWFTQSWPGLDVIRADLQALRATTKELVKELIVGDEVTISGVVSSVECKSERVVVSLSEFKVVTEP